MKVGTQEAMVALLRADPTVDNRYIMLAVDVAKGKWDLELLLTRVDRVMSRQETAKILGCSLRLVDELGKSKALKRVRLTGKERGKGYLLSAIRRLQIERQAN